MTSFFRPVFFTASTTRRSSQAFMNVRLIGFWSGKTAWSWWKSEPPRSSLTVVRIVGMPNAFAVFASPVTLWMTIVGS
jgi:hypothetical protein